MKHPEIEINTLSRAFNGRTQTELVLFKRLNLVTREYKYVLDLYEHGERTHTYAYTGLAEAYEGFRITKSIYGLT